MELSQSPILFISPIIRAADSGAEALPSSSATEVAEAGALSRPTLFDLPSSPEASGDDPMDEDDSEGEGVDHTPLHSRRWLKNIVRLWQVFIDTQHVRQQFLYCIPENVLSAKTFDHLKNIRRLYEVSSQPWNDEEMKYCEIMLTAAIVRRAELHERKHRQS